MSIPYLAQHDVLQLDEHFICECSHSNHTLRFSLTSWGDPNPLVEFTTDVYLAQPNSFWRRCWTALRYVFGLGPEATHFDVWSLQPRDADRLIEMLQRFKAEYHKHLAPVMQKS